MINPPSVQQKCAVFSRKDTGDETPLFFAPQTEGRQFFSAARSGKNTRQIIPRIWKSSRTKTAAGTPNGRNPEHRFSQAKAWGDVAGTLRAAAAHAALCAWARPQAGRSPSPQRGRNQKNGRRLRSKKMKQDARLSNKKAARPHEDSARTSRLTGKAFSDRS